MDVRKGVRTEDGPNRGGPLHGHKFVLPKQDLAHIVGAHDAHRGVPEEVRFINVSILLSLHP